MTKPHVFWFLTGSQHLYGPETLKQVEDQARQVAQSLHTSEFTHSEIVFQPVLTTSDDIYAAIQKANEDASVAGVITWMHTFSPAKMWIAGLSILQKPLLHLHTQWHREIPWSSIDMDFMNLNQAAHGDREFGFISTRMRVPRKVIAGHVSDVDVQRRVGSWMRTALGVAESRRLRVTRFGDNMRQVAVTEGDKVEAQIRFGWSVNGYGVGDLVAYVRAVSDSAVAELLEQYEDSYAIAQGLRQDERRWAAVCGQARIELGLSAFLKDHGSSAFTTTFEDLHGLEQLPGLAVQRLMAQGIGFGGEGDWKTSALLRVMKVMAGNVGTSFMEDYTYHLEPDNHLILGAHMLEVCPTIAQDKPRIEVQPLSIGNKADPARLVFNGRSGAAICVTIVDLGHRFRLVINEVDAVDVPYDMPKLPVARVLWRPRPTLITAAEAWLYAGGAHHTVFSYQVTTEQMTDWAELMGIECVVIDRHTDVYRLRRELQWGDSFWA